LSWRGGDAEGPEPTPSSSPPGLPLARARTDRHLWVKVAALWHRERARDAYESAGYEPHDARRLANEEALLLARGHGWRGDLAALKRELANLLDPMHAPQSRSGTLCWEDVARADMRRLLALPAPALEVELSRYLRRVVACDARLDGPEGLYKLAYLIGFVPTMEHLNRRNAFLRALAEVGNDPQAVEPDLYRVVFRILRPYTMRPFESRQGFSMPALPAPPPRRSDPLPRPRRFARLQRRLFGRLRRSAPY